ncbi:hypothetical protein Btru_073112 [Bulinus truncatus]|nr:hypothetical protein Btru_073112 [Bulinus truncatus]
MTPITIAVLVLGLVVVNETEDGNNVSDDVCSDPLLRDHCAADSNRYYYNNFINECLNNSFGYWCPVGGNSFPTLEDCWSKCEGKR